VPADNWARGDARAARLAFAAVGRLLGQPGEEAAESVLSAAARGTARTVELLLADRRMSRHTTDLIGGGGGAGALVPAVGKVLGLPVRIAPNAAVVSAIGTALALIRERVERTVPNAAAVDMLSIRREAAEAVIRAGGAADSITVEVEYDAPTALLRAIATGQTELRERDLTQALASDEERLAAAAKSLRVSPEQVEVVADTNLLRAYRASHLRKRLLGLLSEQRATIALVDQQAITRLLLPGGTARAMPVVAARAALAEMLDQYTRYGDAGAELPQVFLGSRARVVNLSGLASSDQVLALARAETSALPAEELVLIAVAPRSG
jgi:N-methylhydantoinase A/oxoprolinase/acetone carboxylase beta subunit